MRRYRFIRVRYANPLLVLAIFYAATLQTQIGGSFQERGAGQILKNEYIKDVAEIQVALNVWGTIHHTGYPLFAILGNLFTIPLRALGVEPAAAASLYAAAWGAVMLGGFALLIWRLTGDSLLALLSAALLGLARSIWIHNVIAEVYSMSLALTVIMLAVALWPGAEDTRRRVFWLALVGGIGVAHHRAVAFVAPGLIAAVWPGPDRTQWRKWLPAAIGLALAGFIPYIYMPLRAWQHAEWVYGEPGTLRGLWIEFSGKEADRLVRLPRDLAGLWDNITGVWGILVREITLPGLIAGLIGLALAMTLSPHRRAARIVALSAAGPTLFAIFYHTAVLPEAVLMPTVLALVFGVALAVDWLLIVPKPKRRRKKQPHPPPDRLLAVRPYAGMAALIGIGVWALALAFWNFDYVHELTTERSGLQTIERLKYLPRDGKPALMFPWGPRYAAASYARLVTGEYRDLLIVDHKANYSALLGDNYQLYTEPETFYTYPPPWPSSVGAPSDWWTQRIGQLHLTSAAPGYVQLLNAPWLAGADDLSGEPVLDGILRRSAWLTCDSERVYLHVIWGADNRPSSDPSIFVHLTADIPAPDPPNADSRHPVYGLYPFVEWSPGEIVRDDFTLPRLPDKTQVRFGLYERDTSGQFVNYGETILPVAGCETIGG